MNTSRMGLVGLLMVIATAATTSAPSAAADAYTVTATANKTTLVLGQRVVITGSVSPGASGEKVVLQKRYKPKAKWEKERRATISSDGTFKVSDRPTSLKPRWYRVVKPATSSHASGTSGEVRVDVYRWHYVSDLDYHENEWVDYGYTQNINGTAYKKSLAADDGYGTNWIEYNVNRKCIKLRAVYGLDDDSDTGAYGQIEVLGDGNSLYSHNFNLGQSEKKTLDVSNVLRLRLEFTALNDDDYYSYGAAGSPRILCAY